MTHTKKRAEGHITIVQEERFRLLTSCGRGFLFTLAHDAPIDALLLQRFRDEHTPVVVEYEGEPGLASAVARAVCQARPERAKAHALASKRILPGYQEQPHGGLGTFPL